MPIQVASNIIPKNSAKWPVLEDVFVKGGLRVVADAAARDAIYPHSTASYSLKVGMLLITADTGLMWQYSGAGVWKRFKNTFSHEQNELSEQWDVAHNFGTKFFSFNVFDSEGYAVQPNECKIVDFNNLVLYFAEPIIGHATFVFDV